MPKSYRAAPTEPDRGHRCGTCKWAMYPSGENDESGIYGTQSIFCDNPLRYYTRAGRPIPEGTVPRTDRLLFSRELDYCKLWQPE